MTDARDIVERLRLDAERQVAWHSNYARAQQANEAAETIASLRKQLEDARSEALEEAAECAERYPSPMDDLPMALAIRSVAKAIRALKGKS